MVTVPATKYVELSARTNFSFLQAASAPEMLVRCAAHLGYDAIGIADRDGLYGMVRGMEEAEQQGIRLVVGCELTVRSAVGQPWSTVFLHVATHEGYTNLCRV